MAAGAFFAAGAAAFFATGAGVTGLTTGFASCLATIVTGAGAGWGASGGMVAAGLVGSTLGEQAARSATPAKGMISIKRRRLVDVDMVDPVK